MCRWLAYSGSPVLLEELLYKPAHSLIDQSLHSRLGRDDDERRRLRRRLVRRRRRRRPSSAASSRPGTTATCASSPRTSRRRSSSRTSAPRPARRSRRRTATRSATAAGSGCTTARSASFHASSATRPRRRPVALPGDRGLDRLGAVLLPRAHASGSRTTPRRGRAGGRADRGDRPPPRRRAPDPDDASRRRTASSVWAFRYSSEGDSRSLFYSTEVATLRAPVPRQPRAPRRLRRDPARRLGAARRPAGRWNEVPESSYGVVQAGQDELRAVHAALAAATRCHSRTRA